MIEVEVKAKIDNFKDMRKKLKKNFRKIFILTAQ